MLENLSDPFYQTLAIIGLFITFFGLVSLFIKERLYLTESLVAVLIGIIFGPKGVGIVVPTEWFSDQVFFRILLEFSRIIISFQVMAVGLSIPGIYIKKHWRDILMFLGPIMCLMWAVSSFAVWIFSGLDFWTALMVGACLAPTDPVLANAVIKGKFANRYIPSHLRNLISIESGANDGLGFPFLMLPICLVLHNGALLPAMGDWFLHTWIYEITLSIIIGAVVGLFSKKALEASQKYKLIDNDSFLAYSMAVAIATTGLVALISSDDLLAVFIAGSVFSYDDDRYAQATRESHFQEVLDMLFNLIFFIMLGAIFPWKAFAAVGIGRLLLTAGTILVFRRLPFVMLMRPLIVQLRTGREAFFAGWFGPMGVGAIFFTMVCKHHTGIPEETATLIFTIVSFVVLSSIVIHGITVPITHVHLKNRAKRKAARRKGITTLIDHPLTITSDVAIPISTTEADNPASIVEIENQPVLRDIPEPRLAVEDDRHLVYDTEDDVWPRYLTHHEPGTMPSIFAIGRKGRVADSADNSTPLAGEETDTLTTTEDDLIIPRRSPYRMRPVTTTDFEEDYDELEDDNRGKGDEELTADENATSLETFDGRRIRQEQLMARLKNRRP